MSHPPLSSLKIRSAAQCDLEQIFALEQHATTAAHWPLTAYEALLIHKDSAQPRRVLLVASRPGESAAIEIRDEVAGFCVASFLKANQTSELENIAIARSARRTGIGRTLLRHACTWARQQGAGQIHAEVRESNIAALGLYRDAGFEQSARRHCYYEDPAEDALLLRMPL